MQYLGIRCVPSVQDIDIELFGCCLDRRDLFIGRSLAEVVVRNVTQGALPNGGTRLRGELVDVFLELYGRRLSL